MNIIFIIWYIRVYIDFFVLFYIFSYSFFLLSWKRCLRLGRYINRNWRRSLFSLTSKRKSAFVMFLQNSNLLPSHLVSSKVSQSFDCFFINTLFFYLFDHPSHDVVLNKLVVILLALSPPSAKLLFINLNVFGVNFFLFESRRRSVIMWCVIIWVEKIKTFFFNYFSSLQFLKQSFNSRNSFSMVFNQDIFIDPFGSILQSGELFIKIDD